MNYFSIILDVTMGNLTFYNLYQSSIDFNFSVMHLFLLLPRYLCLNFFLPHIHLLMDHKYSIELIVGEAGSYILLIWWAMVSFAQCKRILFCMNILFSLNCLDCALLFKDFVKELKIILCIYLDTKINFNGTYTAYNTSSKHYPTTLSLSCVA